MSGALLLDEIAEIVERTYYPADPIGTALPLGCPRRLEGTKTALIAILIYLVALPFILFAGLGFLILLLPPRSCSAASISSLPQMRFRSPAVGQGAAARPIRPSFFSRVSRSRL